MGRRVIPLIQTSYEYNFSGCGGDDFVVDANQDGGCS